MPGELALELHHFHFLTVQFPDDLRAPVLIEGGEFFREVHFLHRES